MKPSIPSGTRDFSPKEMVKRNFILDTIRKVYVKYGYEQIETPAMENLSTLEGKYGEEGDKLLFRILNSGPVLDKIAANPTTIKRTDVTEKGLRYDLTVPFARFVVMHQNDITFPFKRFQIQPVWRADRPQKGRYREFFQCDADVIGSNSLLNEMELIQIMDEVFHLLQIPVTIKINNRKILSGLAEAIGEKDKIVAITVAIDKLDKIGVDGVNKEWKEKGVSEKAIQSLQPLISTKGSHLEKISVLKKLVGDTEIGKKGIEEIEFLFSNTSRLNAATFELDITLARGLNYYTGTIFEVKANTESFSVSIVGGGRYDDLTGIFGLPNMSGVGISFGVDRIYDVMNELNLFDKLGLKSSTTKVLLTHFGDAERNYCMKLGMRLRNAGINTELYPDITKKIAKQFDYANKKEISYVIVVGGDEMKSGELAFKNMGTGEQQKLSIEKIIELLSKK